MKTSTPETPLRVALYIRVSTDEQVERFGIPLQKDALLALIKSRPENMLLAGEEHIYVDEGVSGTVSLDERPQFARLKEAITFAPEGQKPFDAVAVYKIDRFARKLKILLDIIDFFDENDIKFISANESIDTSTPFGKAMLGIIGVIAELERDTIVQRTQAGRKSAFESGVAMGVIYGYMKDEYKHLKVFDVEARVVEQIFHMLVQEGRTTDFIAKYLTAHKNLSPRASSIAHHKKTGEIRKKNEAYFWQTDAVRRILKDQTYIGKIWGNKTKNGKPLPRSEWTLSPEPSPTIIDMVTFAKAQQLLDDSLHTKKEAKDGHVYLLRSLLRCSCCYVPEKDTTGMMRWSGERREITKGSGRFTYYYKCPRKNMSKSLKWCPALPLPAKEVEDYVVDFAREFLKSPIATFNHQQELISQKNTAKHLKQKEEQIINLINGLPSRKERLVELHEAGGIDTKQLKLKFEELTASEKRYRTELEGVRKEISQTAISQGYIESLQAFSQKYKSALKKTFTDRAILQTLLHELVEEIVVHARPTLKGDIIAGKQKEGQQIPYKLQIRLKLPQDILQSIHMPELSDTNEHTGVDTGSGYKPMGGAVSVKTCKSPFIDKHNLILYCYDIDTKLRRIG